MKLTQMLIVMGLATSTVLAFPAIFGNQDAVSLSIAQNDDAMTHHVLEKRDAFTCYGDSANVTDCQAALEQLKPLGDRMLNVTSELCLDWTQNTCNIRFCAQPTVLDGVNRTASWIYNWTNSSLMNCVRGGQYALMGDSMNLNGSGGTYRLHVEHFTPTHT
ncbi:hypothetical protein GGS21DRAFT_496661 [Xylaria nigripes]|nr:hypothetical protein GGS21DRAFT_496661 [Xylaria nigripes]